MENDYGRHPSEKLCEVFPGYQGVNPQEAQIVFFGLDANFDPDIDKQPIFSEVLDYLKDGVTYWKTCKRHHPFLNPAYRGQGRRYHVMFRKLQLDETFAAKISFVELLPFPTFGNTQFHKLRTLLNPDFLHELDQSLRSGSKKVFITIGTLRELAKVAAEYRVFDWSIQVEKKYDLESEKNQIFFTQVSELLSIYVIKHLSYSSGIQLEQIKSIIE